MGFEPALFIGRPCDLSRCASSADPSMSFAHRFSLVSSDWEAIRLRDIGLDVHLDFCEVAICENVTVRSAGRVETTPKRLELFAKSLAADDRVALEVTANSWEIARILEGHVARVIVVSPADTGTRPAAPAAAPFRSTCNGSRASARPGLRAGSLGRSTQLLRAGPPALE